VRRRRGANRPLCAAAALLAAVGCTAGYQPSAVLSPASTSGESVIGQIGDEQLTLRLREALAGRRLTPGVTPHVFIAHAFLVGSVDSPERAQAALAVARGVSGVASVDSYIVVSPRQTSRQRSNDAAIEGTARVLLGANPAARAGHVDVVSVGGHVVLLGVVPSAEARASVEATVLGVGGVTGVTNFLLLPERE
jgi:osmotically-inducible protein OsmY